MRFLVIGKGIDYGGPINPADFAMFSENVILPSIEMIKEWRKKRRQWADCSRVKGQE